MQENIFYKPSKNKPEDISFHLPFVPFEQTWTINGQSKTHRRFACNCVVNGERRIASLPRSVAEVVQKYADSKALKKDAVVDGQIFFDAPDGKSPLLYSYTTRCYDSRPSIINFEWNLKRRVRSLKEIIIGTGNKKTNS